MSATDEPGAIAMFVAESRVFINQNDHMWLVIHKTAGGSRAQDIAHFFATDPAMASTHYIVGQDGAIVQCVLEKDGAGGNCCVEKGYASFLPGNENLNLRTISIEHCDPAADNLTPLTAAQKAASFRLIQHICERHNIPMRRAQNDGKGGIIGHCNIAPISRARCPGNYPWDELWVYLASADSPAVAASVWNADDLILWNLLQGKLYTEALPTDTGIAQMWLRARHKGYEPGPPLGPEWRSKIAPHLSFMPCASATAKWDHNTHIGVFITATGSVTIP